MSLGRISCFKVELSIEKRKMGQKRFFSNLLRSRERTLSPSYDYVKRTSDCDERRVRCLILTDFVQERYFTINLLGLTLLLYSLLFKKWVPFKK